MDDADQVTLQLVAERIRGLSRLTEQGFVDIQRQLDRVSELPAVVSELRTSHVSLEQRVAAIESDRSRGAEFRRGSLPLIFLTLVLALTSIIAILVHA